MGNNKTTIEIIAPSVEEAISRGIEELGVTKDDISIEVMDEGSKGLFGLGGRHARVRLTFKFDQEKPVDSWDEEYDDSDADADAEADSVMSVAEEQIFELTPLEVAKTVVYDLLDRMKIKARVEVRYGEPEDSHDQKVIYVDISGDDLSILIGRKSETLNALQYISGLIISKKLGYWVPLVVDVQGYRSRRENQLRRLARRMAEQAIQTGRRQYLEPMPANERRMIHLELRDNEMIKTESIGEEPSRKVTIVLRK
jgi:spoIIIJ-associated protein